MVLFSIFPESNNSQKKICLTSKGSFGYLLVSRGKVGEDALSLSWFCDYFSHVNWTLCASGNKRVKWDQWLNVAVSASDKIAG